MARYYRAVALVCLIVVSTGLYLSSINHFTELEIKPSDSALSDYKYDEPLSYSNPANETEDIEPTARSSISPDNVLKEPLVKENNNTVEISCTPSKKLIFAKTHKTGSTTLQNIIFRFGENNRLMFVLPKSKSHFFNLKAHFTVQMAELYSHHKSVK